MKISEMIQKLQELQQEHGDLPVFYWEECSTIEATNVQFRKGRVWDKNYTAPDTVVIDDGKSV